MTTYPRLVSSIDLKNFILGGAKFYKIVDEGSTVGLAYYLAHNPNYVFFKLKVNQNKVSVDSYEILLRDFLRFIKREIKDIERIETHAYEFDKTEVELLDKLGLKREVTKQKELYKDNRFWCLYVYSLIDEEIESAIKGEEND